MVSRRVTLENEMRSKHVWIALWLRSKGCNHPRESFMSAFDGLYGMAVVKTADLCTIVKSFPLAVIVLELSCNHECTYAQCHLISPSHMV